MRVYICGNKDDRKRFKQAEILLSEQGHAVVNPIRVIYALPKDLNNSDFTIIAFELIRICDALYLMEGWENDITARLEVAHAKRNMKTILI